MTIRSILNRRVHPPVRSDRPIVADDPWSMIMRGEGVNLQGAQMPRPQAGI